MMMTKLLPSFHLVNNSPWPLFMSFSLFSSMLLLVDNLIFTNKWSYFFFSLLLNFMVIYGWMRDIMHESVLEGEHTKDVQLGLKLGVILFIVSELFFFISFFWSLFHTSLSVSECIVSWPPKGINSIDPMKIPLLGTMILISSGVSVTWSHNSLINCNKLINTIYPLMLTILLGIVFTSLQIYEFMSCSFSMNDSVYGSLFFMMTGFHGLHVIIGTLALTFSLYMLSKNWYSNNHHVSYEFAIWYWHFVDVIWLYLYVCVYWWGY